MTKPRPRNERAIAVAKDILERLNLGQIQLTTESYIQLNAQDDVDSIAADAHPAWIESLERDCEVCLVGAAVLAAARLGYTKGQIYFDGSGIRLALLRAEVFDSTQETLIETAFQRVPCYGGINNLDYYSPAELAEYRRAVEFGERHDGVDGDDVMESSIKPDSIARAVMENVVANGGWFVP